MFCWHRWGRWSDPRNTVMESNAGNGYFAVAQMRICDKCGKAQVRKLAQLRRMDEIPDDPVTERKAKTLR